MQDLLNSIRSAGCPDPSIVCACCRKSRPFLGGFTVCNGDKGIRSGITLCVNTGNQNDSYANVIENLAHELQHVLDCCKGRLKTCEDYICSEINAYNLGGSCQGKVGDDYRNCIVERALFSIKGSSPCKGTDAELRNKINDMYRDCMNRK